MKKPKLVVPSSGQWSTMSSLFSKAPPKAKEEKAAERAEADERKNQA
jgi:hypothetical protein